MKDIHLTASTERQFHLSDIYFGSSITLRIIDLETGADDIFEVNDENLIYLYPQFKNKQDVMAIKQLQALNA